MRIPLKSLASGALASLMFAGTAHAGVEAEAKQAASYPRVMTSNAIYKTGPLELKTCEEVPVQADDLEGVRVYLEFLLDCLNESWSKQLAKAGIPFVKPKFQVIPRIGPSACGRFPKGAQAVYCWDKRTMVVLLDKALLAEPYELDLMHVIAHEYGHHVQNLTGILPALSRMGRKASEKVRLGHVRRVELQAECMSGAFIGSVWHSLGRKEFDFKYIVKMAQYGDSLSHGKGKNIAHWLKKGWDAEGPQVCNTFKAPKGLVS
ncbi:neutral zinc metallopeptidase [Sinosporangium siamense]|nr:neutral zinc metallopeptidase [Sinosporangium siamense]